LFCFVLFFFALRSNAAFAAFAAFIINGSFIFALLYSTVGHSGFEMV
jgi:hypothetical protein